MKRSSHENGKERMNWIPMSRDQDYVVDEKMAICS